MNAEQSNQDTVTHDDLAQATGVSVTTIKSYRRKFPGFIPVAGFGKPIRFQSVATDVCLLIRDCFAEGLSVRETRKRIEAAGYVQDAASVPPPSDAGSASDERMDEFLRAAGIMMQSVAKLAEAQRQTDIRLEKMEGLIKQLAASEAESRQALALLQQQTEQAGTDQARRFGTPPPNAPKAAPKRIVKVRSSQGKVDSYTLGSENCPPDELLDVPVAIRTKGGEYLGLPGRLTLRRLAELLPEQGNPLGDTEPQWSKEGEAWRFELANPGGKRCGLCFETETTPAGMQLAVMTRLFLDGVEANGEQRMGYFRQLKNRYAGK